MRGAGLLLNYDNTLDKMNPFEYAKVMKIEEIIDQLKQIIAHDIPPGSKVFLFGSWGKGTAIPTSDIDIGILGNEKIPHAKMVQLREEMEKIPTLRSIDIVDLQAVDKNFKNQALKGAKEIL